VTLTYVVADIVVPTTSTEVPGVGPIGADPPFTG